ncbi:FAD binding domain-containing protein [Glacieibacterium megasporae]|uniref:FAD binding domain-containing protein n=1 Tax=Glacieibacterium megasporae TaxID=2835787 RepID=UPI0021030C91|nr:FAD binding domain-containing protein [Polymorphobacter megasporae]
MTPFLYEHASDVADAIARIRRAEHAQFIAGGTSQVDLLKEGVQHPAVLVDIFRIGLDAITETESGGISIGANVRNSVAADHPVIRDRYTGIAEALHAGASQQIRNMASMAGNLPVYALPVYARPGTALQQARPR